MADPTIPCPLTPSHRLHYGKDKEACANYEAAPRVLKGHHVACKWEGYITPGKCGCPQS